MRKKIQAFILLIFTIANQSDAQNFVYKFKNADGGKWGYADINGKTIIEPQYRNCSDFSDCGIALVYEYIDSPLEFININNQKIQSEPEEFSLKTDYSENYIQAYQNGFVGVYNDEKWGYLNSLGKLTIPFKYDEASVFSENHAIVKTGDNYLIIDTNGVETPIKVNNIKETRSFTEGLARIKMDGSNYAYINYNGDVIINLKALGCGYFSSGFSWVRSINKKIGFIDKSGAWKIEPKFEIVHDFDKESGMALVKENGEWKYVDTTGKILNVDLTVKFVSFSNGLARGFVMDIYSEKKETFIGYFDNTGKWVIKPVYENVRDFKNGYAAVSYEGKWGFIDKTGNWVIKPAYAHIGDVIKIK